MRHQKIDYQSTTPGTPEALATSSGAVPPEEVKTPRVAAVTAGSPAVSDSQLLDWLDFSPARQLIGERNEYGQPRYIAQDRMDIETIDCCGPTARSALRCAYLRQAGSAKKRQPQVNVADEPRAGSARSPKPQSLE